MTLRAFAPSMSHSSKDVTLLLENLPTNCFFRLLESKSSRNGSMGADTLHRPFWTISRPFTGSKDIWLIRRDSNTWSPCMSSTKLGSLSFDQKIMVWERLVSQINRPSKKWLKEMLHFPKRKCKNCSSCPLRSSTWQWSPQKIPLIHSWFRAALFSSSSWPWGEWGDKSFPRCLSLLSNLTNNKICSSTQFPMKRRGGQLGKLWFSHLNWQPFYNGTLTNSGLPWLKTERQNRFLSVKMGDLGTGCSSQTLPRKPFQNWCQEKKWLHWISGEIWQLWLFWASEKMLMI